MKKTIEITASFTGKISTGSYENMSPFYSLKEVIDIDAGEVFSDEEIKIRQKQLHGYCYEQFNKQAEAAHIEKIQKEFKNIRFYPGLDGAQYPSVTSIIGWDKDFHISEEDLTQYASRGTIIDKQVQIYLETGVWKEPKEIPEIYPELVIVRQGSLNLDLDNVNFPAFYEKYPFKVISQQTSVLNHEHRYGGRMEIKCVIESSNKGGWEKMDVKFDVPSLFDVKATTSLDKDYVMKQNTAYAACDLEIQQIGAIHLNKDNQCGYSKPVIEKDPKRYWSLFLKDRENFRKRYGV